MATVKEIKKALGFMNDKQCFISKDSIHDEYINYAIDVDCEDTGGVMYSVKELKSILKNQNKDLEVNINGNKINIGGFIYTIVLESGTIDPFKDLQYQNTVMGLYGLDKKTLKSVLEAVQGSGMCIKNINGFAIRDNEVFFANGHFLYVLNDVVNDCEDMDFMFPESLKMRTILKAGGSLPKGKTANICKFQDSKGKEHLILNIDKINILSDEFKEYAHVKSLFQSTKDQARMATQIKIGDLLNFAKKTHDKLLELNISKDVIEVKGEENSIVIDTLLHKVHEDHKASFNTSYLVKILTTLETRGNDEVTIRYNQDGWYSPIILETDFTTALLMPVSDK